jgi:hypothetical protein
MMRTDSPSMAVPGQERRGGKSGRAVARDHDVVVCVGHRGIPIAFDIKVNDREGMIKGWGATLAPFDQALA